MSEQNNNQQGYVQGGQVYNQEPQQGGQMYNQGYPQQGGQMYNQGYPQQGGQVNNQGYVQGGQMFQQPYQRQAGGTPPKGNKPKTGLVIGIVIAAIALIAGIILIIFKDKIFGSDDKKKTTEDITTEFDEPTEPTETQATTEEPTTEITVEIEGGYDTAEDLMENFWESFAYCDKEQMYQCFYQEDPSSAMSAENNYNIAVAKQDEITVYLDEITTTFEDCSVDEISDIGTTVVAAKTFHSVAPMQQIVDGDIYDLNDIYDGTVFMLENGKWYLGDMSETDVEITGTTTGDVGSGSSDYDQTQFLGYGDLKAMGDSECGYVDVPSDWILFVEAGGIPTADDWYQMASPDAKSIITMCVYNDGTSAYDYACAIYDTLSSDGTAEEVATATVTIGDYEAYQVYASYGTSYLVTYSFETEDGKLHYVAVEFPEDMINIVVNVEKSFRFTE